MELDLNHNEPTIMHLDLNSCFASIEQQANPLLRGKPIIVATYTTPSGCVLAPSIEAKKEGIKVGMRVRDAQLLYPKVVVLTPDPPKYRDVHLKLRRLLNEYSPNVVPKSIDEAVIDFSGTTALTRGLVNTGLEIKKRIKNEIGEWILCNIGISTNRFLAKLAASLHKPDGLDVITAKNLIETYQKVQLVDLCGINIRYQARLFACGIFTPIDFLNASLQTLQKQVFKSINGYSWYLRLRGWEVDAIDFSRKSYGQSYALPRPTDDETELSKLLMKLCEKMGRRLRGAGYFTQGIHVACLYSDGTHWHKAMHLNQPIFSTPDLFLKAKTVLNYQLEKREISNLAISCYNLMKYNFDQLEIFDSRENRKKELTKAIDNINNKYGEYIITPALMLGLEDKIIDRVAFGGVRELEEW